jgi:hypothetical protein
MERDEVSSMVVKVTAEGQQIGEWFPDDEFDIWEAWEIQDRRMVERSVDRMTD